MSDHDSYSDSKVPHLASCSSGHMTSVNVGTGNMLHLRCCACQHGCILFLGDITQSHLAQP